MCLCITEAYKDPFFIRLKILFFFFSIMHLTLEEGMLYYYMPDVTICTIYFK